MTIHILKKFKFEAGKSLNNQDLMFQSRNIEQVNHQKWQLSLFDTYDRQTMMEEDQDTEVQEFTCWNMKQMAV